MSRSSDILRLLSLLSYRNATVEEEEEETTFVVYDENGNVVIENAYSEKNYNLEYEIQSRSRSNLRCCFESYYTKTTPTNTFGRALQKEYMKTNLGGLVNIIPSPRRTKIVTQNNSPYFVGQFSKDGSNYICASQDKRICLFDTSNWEIIHEIKGKGVGWTIVDVAHSPDNRFIIYSSWNPNIFFCNIETHSQEPLLVADNQFDRVCHFSIKFSPNSSEILSGTSNQNFYLYDLNSRNVTYSVTAHDDDINAVEFVDESSNLILSGSDDSLIKVWDKREKSDREVGVFVGHFSGITHLSSKEDGRYFISNSKDQTIKLWDLRKFLQPNSVRRLTNIRNNFDYRYGEHSWGKREKELFSGKYRHCDDCSAMTYRGHSVFNSLIRSYFSPDHTGNKYIYSGSSNGLIFVYDIITGDIVNKYHAHNDVVRDVSWNPNFPQLVSCSWDGTVRMWDS